MRNLVLLIGLLTVACAEPASRAATAVYAPVEAPTLAPTSDIAARHAAEIRAAATAYPAWGRVDEQPNLAPSLCRAPTPADYGVPSQVRMSAAGHSPHGQKLYYLWASDKDAYLYGKGEIPVGFTIVKESFAAVPADAAHPPSDPHADARNYYSEAAPPAITSMVTSKGERLMTGARKDLFVMTKVGDAPDSDAGWIYGTVAPDGTVTSAGRVASCMACHVGHATRERLFGLPAAPKP